MTLEEFLGVIDDKSPPAPAAMLEAFELEIGLRLPEDYREFLVRCNGGYAAGSVMFRGPTLQGHVTEACPNHIGGFREESYFSLPMQRLNYQSDEELRLPKALLWIMDDPMGNAICLGVADECYGRVYFWDHESEPDPADWDRGIETAGNIDFLAYSFTKFVSGLHGTPDLAPENRPWWKFWR